jgi:probable rRNA maturation factor
VPIEIEINDTQGHVRVDREALVNLARVVLEQEGHRSASVSIALVDDSTIHRVNRAHLGHDWPTDVISFTLSSPDEPPLAGELVVSAEMARATAQEIGVEPWNELALYIVHGLLHLCGYDDSTMTEADAMRQREQEILTGQGLRNPFSMAGGSPEAAVCSIPPPVTPHSPPTPEGDPVRLVSELSEAAPWSG